MIDACVREVAVCTGLWQGIDMAPPRMGVRGLVMSRATLLAAVLVLSVLVRPSSAALIHDAAREGDTSTVVKLLDQQDVNTRDEQVRPHGGLVRRCLRRWPEFAAGRRIDVRFRTWDAVNLQGRTPLHHAVEGHHQEMVELLVESGADLVAQNDVRSLRMSPLHVSHAQSLTRHACAMGAATARRDAAGPRRGSYDSQVPDVQASAPAKRRLVALGGGGRW